MREDVIIYENTIPQIISKEIFDKAMERRRTKKYAENTAKNIYLLSGIIKCQCGGSFIGFTSVKVKNGKTYKNGYYKYSNHGKLKNCNVPSIKQDLIENKIIQLLTNELLDKNNMQKIVDTVNRQYKMLQNESTQDVLDLTIRIKEIQTQIDNIVDMVCKGISTDALGLKLKALEETKRNLEDELTFKSSKFVYDISAEDIVHVLKKDVDKLQTSSKSELKNLIHKWIKKIEATNDFIDVYFNSEDLISHKMVARSGFEPPTCWV